ncbi:MAG: hypothetical protein CMK59_02325 [Proteobacteria bacterium]|nr:hypothetical protein [Pseudomonadota bacterium]
MSWTVARRNKDKQTVESLEKLKEMAQKGQLVRGDLVQPPQANDWLYAFELPGMEESFRGPAPKYVPPPSGMGKKVFGVGLILVSLGVIYTSVTSWMSLAAYEDLELLGERGLGIQEGMTTNEAIAYAGHSKDEKNLTQVGTMPANMRVQLLEKEGDRFLIESAKGKGWVDVKNILPAYLFSPKETKDYYDTIYNPHRKIQVINSSWERPEYGNELTAFRFQLQNISPLAITDVVMKVELKDSNGQLVKELLFPIEGIIEARDSVKVGTLKPPKSRSRKRSKSEEPTRYLTAAELDRLQKRDPNINARWLDSIQVSVGKIRYAEASIKIIEANYIEPEEEE